MSRRNWQRHELLLALNLYCRLPFGKYHSRNPQIIKLAQLIDRTPDAVAMKLSNFASFDPFHQSRNIKGLQNTSQADHKIWSEFNSNWDKLAIESETIYAQLTGKVVPVTTKLETETISSFSGTTEISRQVKVRLGQRFFRKVILTSYGNSCCICDMPIRALLVASHIVPWSEDKNLRVNPHNGVCFCTLHDKGFDRGFFTLGKDYEIVIGNKIREYLPNSAVHNGFKIYEGQKINLPDKFIPEQEFLEIHRSKYFLG